MVVFGIACVGGPGGDEQSENEGLVRTTIRAQTAAGTITRVRVYTVPAAIDASITVSDASGAFTGVFRAPVGNYTLYGEAFAASTKVAEGQASVTLIKGDISQVDLVLLDITGPVDVPDHSPWITSFVVNGTTLEVDDVINVSGTARDIDAGDTLAYLWSASPSGCGVFDNAAVSSTTFTARTTGACRVELRVTSGGQSTTSSADVNIVSATSSVAITGSYVPHPVITEIALLQGTDVVASLNRTAADATFRTPLARSATYTVRVRFNPVVNGSLTVTNECLGLTAPAPTVTGSEATATWTTPATGAPTCVVRAFLAHQGMLDEFPVMFVLPVVP
jgi:hypothetical protein